ncbi:MAG: tetratricopeptide repeat protein, partial [Caulobacterales bacterium]|nr:tetratricopeptide repeat protein [Caulobacterales bacterium]
ANEQDRRAVGAFRRAVRADGDFILARRELALALVRRGRTEQAQEQLDELSARLTACAQTCEEAETLAAAVAAVETAMGGEDSASRAGGAVRLASAEAGDAAYLGAFALVNEARYGEALAAMRTAALAFGPHPDVLTYRGFVNRKLGRLDRAEAYYQAALAIAPDHVGATEYYGELHVERGDLVAAAEQLARLDAICAFGCAEADELRRWIRDAGGAPS